MNNGDGKHTELLTVHEILRKLLKVPVSCVYGALFSARVNAAQFPASRNLVHSVPIGQLGHRKENSMARKRYQNGRVFLKGKERRKMGREIREDVVEVTGTTKRVRRSVILGTKRELPTKRPAPSVVWPSILARINYLDYRPGRAATFEFIERWKTEVLTTQKPSSARAVPLTPRVLHHSRGWQTTSGRSWRREPATIHNSDAGEVHGEGCLPKDNLECHPQQSPRSSQQRRNWGYSYPNKIDMKKLRLPHRAVSRLRPRTLQLSRFSESSPPLTENPGARYSASARWMAFQAGKALGLPVGAISTSTSEYFKSEEPLGTGRLRLRRAGKARRHFQFPMLWSRF